ncbi:MAG TPA: DUF669 domain-containing protein [Candidatus Eremiobacteraeota bacterium]|nr:DUF669 domain-containing protein [Candidatus Eremiobacteraeota bacterium]
MKYEEIGTNSSNGGTLGKGKYLCQIKEVTETESKAGVPMLKLKLKIVSGEQKGRTLFDQLSFNCKRPKLLAVALGLAKKNTKEFELDPEKVVNRLIYAKLEEEIYEGTLRSKVAFDGYGKVDPELIRNTLEELKKEQEEDEEEEQGEFTDEEIESLDDIYSQYNL